MLEFREVTERFRLEKILKSTRAGSVLRASDLATAEPAVVKLLSIASAADAEAFLAYAATLAGLSHPSLPAIRDFGVTPDGSAFLVLELLEGRSFESAAGGPARRILPLLDTVAEGLEVLAVHGLAHRNLSPDNLLLVPAERGGVKMLGLGTALFRRPGAPVEPQTARFRPPEEAAPAGPGPSGSSGEIDGARADVYALVRVACQVLGTPVFYEDTPEPQIELPQSFKFELDEVDPLRMALQAALRRNPADRPSLSRLRSALRRAVGAPEPPLIRKPRPVPASEPLRPVAVVPPVPAGPAPTPGLPAAPATLPSIGVGAPAAALGPAAQALPALGAPIAPPGALPAAAGPRIAPATPALAASPALAPVPALDDTGPPALDDTGDEVLSSISDDLLLGGVEEAPAAPRALAPTPPAPPAGPRARPGSAAATPPAAPAARPGLLRLLPGGKGAGRKTAAAPSAAAEPQAGEPGVAPASVWRKPLPLAGVGLVLAAGLSWWLLAGKPAPPPPAPVAAPAPAAPPRVPAGDRLALALDLLGEGEDLRALELLRSLTGEDQQALGPAGCARVRLLEETLGLTAGERLAEDLAGGLAAGDVSRLRLAVRAADALPGVGLSETAQADLAKARQIADFYAKAEEAGKAGDHLAVLSQFGAMETLLGDEVSDSSGLRDRAALAIEAEADALVLEARYDDALARIAPLASSWPDRPGLADKVEAYRQQKDDEVKVAALLASAANTERRKKPDEGLDLLRGVAPTPHLKAQYDQTVGRLQALLAQVDGRPPVVELRQGYILEYDRGTFANLSFRVKDDYKVADVQVFARPQGGKMRELPAEKSRMGAYTVEIAPGFHQNETVEVYVVATDVSGHEGFLGTREQPLQIKRRKGFRE